jgi:NADPH-dependent curcumin reductase CurA
LCEEAVPSIEDGQLLVKNLYISIDPTHRIWMTDCLQVRIKLAAPPHTLRTSFPLLDASLRASQ